MSKEKQYRLKEEVKKYLQSETHKEEFDLEYWEIAGFTLEALEEVKPKRVALISEDYGYNIYKASKEPFNDKEMTACEFMLNELGGSEDSLDNSVFEYKLDLGQYNTTKFTSWLKQQNK